MLFTTLSRRLPHDILGRLCWSQKYTTVANDTAFRHEHTVPANIHTEAAQSCLLFPSARSLLFSYLSAHFRSYQKMGSGFHKLIAIFIAGAAALCLALECVRLYQEIERLGDRWTAFAQDNLAAYDARWSSGNGLFIPGTDVPSHPAAVAFTPLWRIITIM